MLRKVLVWTLVAVAWTLQSARLLFGLLLPASKPGRWLCLDQGLLEAVLLFRTIEAQTKETLELKSRYIFSYP